MIPTSDIANKSGCAEIHTIPGSVFHQDNYAKEFFYLFKSGKATSFGKLEDNGFCKREAKELYDFLIIHTPAGIYKELVLEIVKGDFTCNNYISELLAMSKQEVFQRARDARVGKSVPEKVCTKCNITKPLTEFYKIKSGNVTGSVQSNCIKCVLEYLGEKRKKDKQ